MTDITTADMLEIVVSGGNGSELVELPAIMSKAAKELREKDARIAELEADDAKNFTAFEELNRKHADLWTNAEGLRARIAELEAALEKAKETADAEFTAKLRYRDERMAAEAQVKRLREALEPFANDSPQARSGTALINGREIIYREYTMPDDWFERARAELGRAG